MFIFERSFAAVAAGLAVALLIVCLDRLCQPLAVPADAGLVANAPPPLVPWTPPGVSSAPVRDLSLSCRLPPALASWLPSLKSRIVLDQVAGCASVESM
jgi:hypothetical protein